MDVLLSQLNQNHQDYFHQLTIELIQNDQSDDDIKAVLSQFLPLLISTQNKGLDAFQELGQPQDYQTILSNVTKQQQHVTNEIEEDDAILADEETITSKEKDGQIESTELDQVEENDVENSPVENSATDSVTTSETIEKIVQSASETQETTDEPVTFSKSLSESEIEAEATDKDSQTPHHYTMEEIRKRYASNPSAVDTDDDSILIASPKEKEKITKKQTKQNDKNDNPLLVWIDYSLFVLSLISILTGLMRCVSPTAPNFPLTTLFVMSFYGAGVIYASYVIWTPDHHRKEKNPTNHFILIPKIIGIALLFSVWLVIVNLVNLLPEVFNSPLSVLATLIIGFMSLLVKVILKKHSKIDSLI